VGRVLAEQLCVAPERISKAARLDDDLAATSLDRVEVVMALEDDSRSKFQMIKHSS
jgi:acyl carrier protein